jgi:hypothetical protein
MQKRDMAKKGISGGPSFGSSGGFGSSAGRTSAAAYAEAQAQIKSVTAPVETTYVMVNLTF